jgi:hypothetical protein
MFWCCSQLEAEAEAALETVHPVWSVVLEQLEPDPQLVCKLLSVSRGMRSIVKILCKGQLSVELCFESEQQSQQIATALWQVADTPCCTVAPL